MGTDFVNKQNIRNIQKINIIIQTFPAFAQDYFAYLLEARHLSSRTVLGYAQDLETFFFYLSHHLPAFSPPISPELLDTLSIQNITHYLSFLSVYERNGKQRENTSAGKARKLSSLKSFWKWMISCSLVENNPTLLVVSPKITKKEIVKMDTEEIHQVLKNTETKENIPEKRSRIYSEHISLRDQALIYLLLGTGIRISECVGIDVKDLDFKENRVKIIRKGGNESWVYYSETVKEKISEYMRKERKTPIDNSDALFLSLQQKRLSVRSAQRRVGKYTNSVLSTKHISAHKLRATYATQLYQESHDIYLTADALGHANVQTTSRYADIGNERRKEAASYTDFLS